MTTQRFETASTGRPLTPLPSTAGMSCSVDLREALELLDDPDLGLVSGGRIDSGGTFALDRTISVDRIYRK